MIVSALLTSVGMNLGLCILLFALYSVLRKQPGNVKVYAPRVLAEGHAQQRSRFNIDNLLPTAGWVRRAWHPSEDDLLDSCGLDAVVFMRIIIFSLRVFSVAGVIGIFVLIPVNYLGNQLSDIDFSDLPNKSLDLFSISNVKDGSSRLWVHFGAAYIITGVVCYLLYYEYKYISSKRVAYFIISKPQPQQFTILVRGIPLHGGTTISETVQRFFTEYYPSTYLCHIAVRRKSKLHSLIDVPAAFVCFKSRYDAASALHIRQSIDPTQWVTEPAPEPHDVYWPLFSALFMQRWICNLVVFVASIVLSVVFFIPVAFVQSLTYLPQLEKYFPFLKGILRIAVVSQIITGYLPSQILQLFLSFIPPIMKFFSTMQGYVAHSEIDKSACSKMLRFTVWNIFFANVLSGSIASQFHVFFDPKNIPVVLAGLVPGQATFFIAYTVTSWTNLSLELTCLFPLLKDWIRRHFSRDTKDEFHPPSIAYYSAIPRLLLFGLIGLVYFLLAPLILPFILVYFCAGYIIYRNQLLNVYLPKYETGGRFWPIVHNSTIFALVLMQAILIGTFVLKKLPLASGLVLPLPVLTLLFNEYCRKRFLPIFNEYSAETLIKKDRVDQNDPNFKEFYHKLVDAYREPSAMPISHTVDINDHTAPLLSSIED